MNKPFFNLETIKALQSEDRVLLINLVVQIQRNLVRVNPYYAMRLIAALSFRDSDTVRLVHDYEQWGAGIPADAPRIRFVTVPSSRRTRLLQQLTRLKDGKDADRLITEFWWNDRALELLKAIVL